MTSKVRILQFCGSNNFKRKCSKKKLNVIFVINGVCISFIFKSIYSINYRHSNVFNPLGSWDTDNHGINIKYLPNDFSLTKDVVKKK